MKHIKPRWSKKEIDFLNKNIDKMYFYEISKYIKRTPHAIWNKASSLGLKRNWDGKNNPNWKGGRQQRKNGYIMLPNKKECPYSYKDGKVLEHVYIWWINYPNDKILYNEVIHHKNNVKNDNRIENLEKMKRSKHIILHKKKK